MHFKSVVDSRCPEKPKTIRAETIISGYIIAPMEDGTGGTYLTMVSQNDIKGVIPLTLVNTGASKGPRQWVGNLLNACQDYIKKNKVVIS